MRTTSPASRNATRCAGRGSNASGSAPGGIRLCTRAAPPETASVMLLRSGVVTTTLTWADAGRTASESARAMKIREGRRIVVPAEAGTWFFEKKNGPPPARGRLFRSFLPRGGPEALRRHAMDFLVAAPVRRDAAVHGDARE